jgi:phage tail sheath protein FI
LLSPDDFIQRGLAPLERTPEVAILACPDILIQPVRVRRDPMPSRVIDPCEPCTVPSVTALPMISAEPELPPVFDVAAIFRVQAAMIEQCERLRDRVALIDPPFPAARDDRIGSGPIQAWRSRFDSAFGALYHPWLTVPDPLVRGGTRLVPPSGHVAGQFARADRSVGVHRAAADEPLAWTQAVSIRIDKARHGLLNGLGINVIAGREGRLLRVLGARTMSSDPSWRFIPARRLVCMLRDALDAATQWAVFEPNNDATRLLLQDNISAFLRQLWLRGALAGSSPEQAYRVRCDEDNNDATRRANGELHIDIAIAPAAPLEFIVLRIGRQGNSFELVEDGSFASAMVGGAH